MGIRWKEYILNWGDLIGDTLMSEVVTTNYEKSAEVIVTDKGCNRQLCEGLNFTLNKYYYIITYERSNAENNASWLPWEI